MKHIVFNLSTIILFLWCFPYATRAQSDVEVVPCQSVQSVYENINDDLSIVRTSAKHRVVHTQYWESSTGVNLHTFVMQDLGTGTATAIQTRFDASNSTGYDVSISDMEIYNDVCYFCGTITYTYMNFYNQYVRNCERVYQMLLPIL